MTRHEIDSKTYQIFNDYTNVILEWATGVGKSRAAIIKIRNLVDNSETPISVLLVVAEIAHINNWKVEFEKWDKDLLTNPKLQLQIICYASLHNYEAKSYTLIILDECHHINTPLRLCLLSNIKSQSLLGLSATVDFNTKVALTRLKGPFKIFKITTQEAIDWGLLPQPSIVLVPLYLDNIRASELVIETRGRKGYHTTIETTLSNRWYYLKQKSRYPNLKLIMSCTQKQKYDYLCEKIEYYKDRYMKTNSASMKNMWMHYGSERKRFLGSIKTEYAKTILSKIKDSRFICFCTDINQADELGNEMAIHSKKPANLKTIDKFNNGELDSLFVVGMLKEGQNLVNIEKGLIIQLDGNVRPFIQKSGRVLRSTDPEIIILYFPNTRDEEYLDNALEDINPEYIKWLSLK